MRVICTLLIISLVAATPCLAKVPDPRLEALGALTAAQLYTTWRYLEAADSALGSPKFPRQKVESLMSEADAMTENVARFVTRLTKAELEEADRAYFREAAAILVLLGAQAKALRARAAADSQASKATYDRASTASWARLKSLLNLKSP